MLVGERGEVRENRMIGLGLSPPCLASWVAHGGASVERDGRYERYIRTLLAYYHLIDSRAGAPWLTRGGRKDRILGTL